MSASNATEVGKAAEARSVAIATICARAHAHAHCPGNLESTQIAWEAQRHLFNNWQHIDIVDMLQNGINYDKVTKQINKKINDKQNKSR